MSETMVIVGASLAGSRAAESLRRSGHEGRIVVVGEELDRPYDRPPLSKKFLRGQLEEEKLFLRPAGYYEEHRIELVLGVRATGLDTARRSVRLSDGRALGYDRLLVATGASVRRLACPGHELEGIHYVRTRRDALAIRGELGAGKEVVVIGAGVIGCEAAASLREEGLDVTLIEASDRALVRAFGRDVGAIYEGVHRARGVDVRTGENVRALHGSGRVSSVETDRGTYPCDFVVVGIGVAPATEWLEGSGVATERGFVLVDPACRTNVEGVFAAGDCATHYCRSLERHMVVESVDNAQLQALTAASSMRGEPAEYQPVPFFWSDQYDLKLQSVGYVGEYDEVVFRGSVETPAFVAFHLRAGRIVFAIGVNRLKEIGAARKLIGMGREIDRAILADENVGLGPYLK